MRSKPPIRPGGGGPPSDTPRSGAPRSGAPRSGASRPDSPRSDSPRADGPRFGAPRSDAPRSGASRSDAPYAGGGRAGQSRSEGSPGGGSRFGAAPSGAAPSDTRLRGPTKAPPRDRKAGPRPSRPPEPGQAPRAVARPAVAREPRGDAGAEARPAPRSEAAPRPASAEPGRDTLRAPASSAPYAAPAPRASGPATPRGAVWLHGLHAVAAALANPARRLKRLLLTEDAEATLIARVPQPWPLTVERIERSRLDSLLGRDTVHQGAALLVDLLTPPTLAAVLLRPGPLLVLDQVTDPRNIGATLRSAAAFGAAAVVLQERNAPEETGVMAKAASGALETVPLLRAVNLARTLVALKAAGLWVIGLEANAPKLRGADLAERRVALVLGAEGAGMRRLTRETCDELCGLAMPGDMESLNISAAASVALYELTRPL
jgi:23S rRNA (guanosine2251-2'-O)-methyltransferase